MRLISHRGNLTGRIPERENTMFYIIEAVFKGYDVEVDVWEKNNKLYLGHDEPMEEVDISFLKHDKIWIHCKNISALEICLKNKLHCFFHNKDDCVLTSKGSSSITYFLAIQ